MQNNILRHCIIRADASSWIGTGHVIRCINLAKELIKRGFHVSFLCRYIPNHLQLLLAEENIALIKMTDENGSGQGINNRQSIHGHWLHVNYQDEIDEAVAAINSYLATYFLSELDLLIIDHYAIESEWQVAAQRLSKVICQIDDLADRQHICDVLVDQNYFPDADFRYAERVPGNAKKLLGPYFALLNRRFYALRHQLKEYKSRFNARKVVVFFGGVDESNETDKAITGLLAAKDETLLLDVILGATNPNIEYLKQKYSQNASVMISVQVSDMAERMAEAFLFVGAIGSTTWERCALGLPGIVVSVAYNQNQLAEALQTYGSHVFLGEMKDVLVQDYTRAFLNSGFDGMEKMSRLSSELTDGNGTGRVVDAIEEFLL